MTKKLLLSTFIVVLANVTNAQCDPASHDWMGEAFGVSPDPNAGETFVDGILGEYYNDVVYVLAPVDVTDIDSTFAIDLQIDSISLDSITLFNGLADVQLSNIGLNVTCNNNGDSPNPCMFMPGNAYCGDISGVPTAAGIFPVKIYVKVFFNFFGPQSAPYEFENYTLNIVDPTSILEKVTPAITISQNTPNPANTSTDITFQLSRPENVQFEVLNLLGEKIYASKSSGRKGDNKLTLDTSAMEPGVYLYSIQCADKKFTKRMIVQR